MVDAISFSPLRRPRCPPQGAELAQNAGVDIAHGWCDELGQLHRPDPLPGVEFRMLSGEVDVRIGAGERHRKPFLAIAAIPPVHYPMGDLVCCIIFARLPRDFSGSGQLRQRAIPAGSRSDDFDCFARSQRAVSFHERLDAVAEPERAASAGMTAG